MQSAIIYKITCKKTQLFYVGCTTRTMKKRIKSHIDKKTPIGVLIKQNGLENFKIEHLKELEFIDSNHLFAMETLFINKFINQEKCLNEYVSFNPLWRNKNVRLFREKRCDICNVTVKEYNYSHHIKRKIHTDNMANIVEK